MEHIHTRGAGLSVPVEGSPKERQRGRAGKYKSGTNTQILGKQVKKYKGEQQQEYKADC